MDTDEYERWMDAARARAQRNMDAARQRFGLGSHARYQADLVTATIRFFDAKDVERARADIQVAGTWSPNSGTWMWGWENESVPESAVRRLAPIVEAGRDKDIESLQTFVVECSEADAWSLAALAADIVGADCMYRSGNARSRAYLLLFDLRCVR
jgi:hypothetical protein